MPCVPVQTPYGTAILCTRGRRSRQKCACGRPATLLCDGLVDRGTCNAPCCRTCAVRVGPDRDHCPDCARFEQLGLELELPGAA